MVRNEFDAPKKQERNILTVEIQCVTPPDAEQLAKMREFFLNEIPTFLCLEPARRVGIFVIDLSGLPANRRDAWIFDKQRGKQKERNFLYGNFCEKQNPCL